MRFNTTTRGNSKITNHEGAIAFTMSDELALYTAVASSALQDAAYEGADVRVERLQHLIRKCDPLFVAQLAVYARTSMNLRSVPLLLICELARTTNGSNLVARATDMVVQRADEITELLACYSFVNGHNVAGHIGKLSKQIQKGLASAFNRFDEYQFAKYDRKTAVTLRDALFMVHPKAKDAQQQRIFDKIVDRSLQTPYTWETELSSVGTKEYNSDKDREAAFTKTWEELIDSGRVGYMALLRNLRNILKANVSPAHIEHVCKVLSDPVQVQQSKQFPFRFLSAYRQLENVRTSGFKGSFMNMVKSFVRGDQWMVGSILEALERAAAASAANISGFDADTRVLIACDVSGSMCVPVSRASTVQYYDIGLVLGMLLRSRCRNVKVGMFGDKWKVINVPVSNILSNVQYLRERAGEVGYSTNGHLVIEDLISRRLVMDKVMLFTDCQLWNSHADGGDIEQAWKQYKSKVAPYARLYLFDLAGYGQSPIRVLEDDVHLIAGWSDKIFQVMESIEHGSRTLDVVKGIKM